MIRCALVTPLRSTVIAGVPFPATLPTVRSPGNLDAPPTVTLLCEVDNDWKLGPVRHSIARSPVSGRGMSKLPTRRILREAALVAVGDWLGQAAAQKVSGVENGGCRRIRCLDHLDNAGEEVQNQAVSQIDVVGDHGLVVGFARPMTAGTRGGWDRWPCHDHAVDRDHILLFRIGIVTLAGDDPVAVVVAGKGGEVRPDPVLAGLPILSPAFAMTTPLRSASAPAPSWVPRTYQSPFGGARDC